jgi:NTP pyrophosphatase (non-canonical NTP hydrolase)
VRSKLAFDELLSFIHEYDRFFRRRYRTSKTHRALARTVKLSEEVGELAAAVLASLGDQRSAKLKKFSDHHLADEIADVIITVLVLADAFNIDAREPLKKKMTKITQRVAKW